jgi:N-carbamoylputrescine amidase
MVVSPRGEILAQASDTEDDIAVADVDLGVLAELRELWGYYRDRRPEMYRPVVEVEAGTLHPSPDAEAPLPRA